MAVQRLSIEELAAIVETRKGADPETSYTAKLLSRGVGHCAKKVGEEGVEVAIAALEGERQAIRAEAADLIYHFVVLLAATGVDLEEVYAELGRREGTSGIAEKAGRRI